MAAAHKRCSLVFVHKIDGILKIQCRIKMKKGRWNVPFHYELRFTDSGITKGEKTAGASKLMMLMGLGIKQGDTVTVTITGGDEEKSCRIMREFFEKNL